MILKVTRLVYNDAGTFGKLFINDVFFAYTLEDVERNLNGDCSKKVQNQTAIDKGKYEVVLNFSERFQKYMPQVLNVPCFNGIRIHGGNTAADTEGCILVGADSDMKTRIGNCASKLIALTAAIKAVEKKEKVWIVIV